MGNLFCGRHIDIWIFHICSQQPQIYNHCRCGIAWYMTLWTLLCQKASQYIMNFRSLDLKLQLRCDLMSQYDLLYGLYTASDFIKLSASLNCQRLHLTSRDLIKWTIQKSSGGLATLTESRPHQWRLHFGCRPHWWRLHCARPWHHQAHGSARIYFMVDCARDVWIPSLHHFQAMNLGK